MEKLDIRGKMIYVEGGDGSGKSTQVALLAEYLTELGYKVILIRQPGIPGVGEHNREILFGEDHYENFWAKRMIFIAEYLELVERYGNEKEAVVLCDRCALISNPVYGGAEIANPHAVVDRFKPMLEGVRLPDLVVVYNVDKGVRQARLAQREVEGGDMNYYDYKEERFKDYIADLYSKVYTLGAMPAELFETVSANETVSTVFNHTLSAIENRFNINR